MTGVVKIASKAWESFKAWNDRKVLQETGRYVQAQGARSFRVGRLPIFEAFESPQHISIERGIEAEPDPEAPEVMPGTLTGAAKMLKAPEAAGVALAVNCSPCLRSHITWGSPPKAYMTSRQKHESRLPTTHRKHQFCSALSCTSTGFLRELPDSQDPYGIAQQELQHEHESSHKELI